MYTNSLCFRSYCGCRSGSGIGFPFYADRDTILPQVLLMLENKKFFYIYSHLFVVIGVIIYNIFMDIIFGWRKKAYGSRLAGDSADPDQPPTELCRADRIRIHNTGNRYKCPDL